MKDWHEIVRRHHMAFHGNDEYQLVISPPATEAELASLRGLFPYSIPFEMESFYQSINGFGKSSAHYPLLWFFLPISKLESACRSLRDTFGDSHADLAQRFLPFVDWFCGDYSGYLWSEDGTLLDGLYIFEHENFRYESGQDISEFMFCTDASIEEFLEP